MGFVETFLIGPIFISEINFLVKKSHVFFWPTYFKHHWIFFGNEGGKKKNTLFGEPKPMKHQKYFVNFTQP